MRERQRQREREREGERGERESNKPLDMIFVDLKNL